MQMKYVHVLHTYFRTMAHVTIRYLLLELTCVRFQVVADYSGQICNEVVFSCSGWFADIDPVAGLVAKVRGWV
jgi:hypothetical protein